MLKIIQSIYLLLVLKSRKDMAMCSYAFCDVSWVIHSALFGWGLSWGWNNTKGFTYKSRFLIRWWKSWELDRPHQWGCWTPYLVVQDSKRAKAEAFRLLKRLSLELAQCHFCYIDYWPMQVTVSAQIQEERKQLGPRSWWEKLMGGIADRSWKTITQSNTHSSKIRF
jgi:hypothetical protein